ncbi:EamA family transporter [Amycolatopsis sp. WAC 01376]|uniref:DMT family transporter n=1 Tax=Amycolatopsis sp. WAC 01376 TaxID=2203195 RepID=UPI000F795687|nr:DMT family transporter [Amycolatopsis sp. WAC 01376]RSM53539.1 EamA family transporter [Amycolatopsis sp. WAC 01376]
MTRIKQGNELPNLAPGAQATEPAPYGPVVCVVLAAAVLSSSYTLTKVALRDVPPLTIGLIRFALAALVLAVWVHVIRRYPRPSGADLRRLAIGGLLGITCYFAIENIGVQLATAADAALLVAAYPAITAFLELVIYRQRTQVSGLIGIAFAIVGVCFVVGYAPSAGGSRLIGDILLVVSGVVWALYNFVTRTVANRYPTPVVLYYQSAAGAVAFVPLALIEADQWRMPEHPAATVGSLAALTVLCSIAGLGLYAKALQRLRPSTAVNLLNLVPIFGLLIAVVTLGESVTPLQLAGGIVVVIGVTITTRYEHRKSGRRTGS